MADLDRYIFETEEQRKEWRKRKGDDIVNVFYSEDEYGFYIDCADRFRRDYFESDKYGNRGNYQKFGY